MVSSIFAGGVADQFAILQPIGNGVVPFGDTASLQGFIAVV